MTTQPEAIAAVIALLRRNRDELEEDEAWWQEGEEADRALAGWLAEYDDAIKAVESLHAECEELRAETVVVIDGHQIRLAEVLRRIIRGIEVKRGRMLWAAVHELTAHGSTVSAGLCRWAGLDPSTGTELAARAAIKEQG